MKSEMLGGIEIRSIGNGNAEQEKARIVRALLTIGYSVDGDTRQELVIVDECASFVQTLSATLAALTSAKSNIETMVSIKPPPEEIKLEVTTFYDSVTILQALISNIMESMRDSRAD